MNEQQLTERAEDFFARFSQDHCFVTHDGNVFEPRNERLARTHARDIGSTLYRFDRRDVEENKKARSKASEKQEEAKKKESEEASQEAEKKEEQEEDRPTTEEVEQAVTAGLSSGVLLKKNNTVYYGETKLGGSAKTQRKTFQKEPSLLEKLQEELGLGDTE